MGLFDFIGPASGLLFTLENIIWINLGVFIGCVFAAIPGLSVILCIILFLPVTYVRQSIGSQEPLYSVVRLRTGEAPAEPGTHHDSSLCHFILLSFPVFCP